MSASFNSVGNDAQSAQYVEYLAQNKVLLFLGAGVSAQLTNEQPVLWNDLLRDALYDLTQNHPSGEWSEAQERLHEGVRVDLPQDKRAAALAQLYESTTGDPQGLKRYIADKIGRISYRDDKGQTIAEFLRQFSGPIITTNYDTLLEDVTGRTPVVPREWSELGKAVYEQGQEVVIHLHGYHDAFETIVFGWDDYAHIISNDGLQKALHGVFTSHHAVFIGCGGTADDLNVGGLFAWMSATWRDPQHLFLYRDGETLPTPVTASKCIEKVAYGSAFSQLGPWLTAWRERALEKPITIRPPRHPSRQVEDRIDAAITDFRLASIADAKYEALRELRLIIGTLAERMSASFVYLFLKHGDVLHLQPELSQPLESEEACLKLNEGIVGHVATTGRPYHGIELKTRKDPYYRCKNKATNSELAVPIFAHLEDGTREVLGVLSLQSIEPHGFLDSYVGEAVAAATEMAPHIQIWNHLDQDPSTPTLVGWHPNIHTWDLGHLLNRFCDTISRLNIDKDSDFPRPSVSIWYYDEANRRLYGRGAYRFGYEYLNKHTVREDDSFLGGVLHRGEDVQVSYDSLKTLGSQRYQKPRQAQRMGLQWLIATPFCVAHEDSDYAGQRGVLCLFFYKGANRPGVRIKGKQWLKDRYTAEFVRSLAIRLGDMIASLRKLREDVAHSYVAYRMATRPVPDTTELCCELDAMLRCFDADMGTIFTRRDVSADLFELVGHATTGLLDQSLRPIAAENARYLVSVSGRRTGDEGLTTELCSSERLRGKRPVLRVVKANDQLGKHQPTNKFIETLSPGETSHRAILGWAVIPPDEDRDSQNVLGAVRLLRFADSSPFVDRDEALAIRISGELVHPLSRWHAGWSRPIERQSAIRSDVFSFLQPGGVCTVGSHEWNAAWNAAGRLLRAVCTYERWNLRSIETILCDLVTTLADQGAFMASLWVAEPSYEVAKDDGRYLRPAVFYSAESGDPPSDRYETEPGRPTVGTFALQNGLPVSWSGQHPRRFREGHPDSKAIAASVNFPMTVCSPHAGRSMHMVFCIDFKQPLGTETMASLMPSILLAALKTGCMVSDNTKFPARRGENMPDTGPELLDLFCSLACREVGLTDIVLCGYTGDSWQPIHCFGDRAEELLGRKPKTDKRQNWSLRTHALRGGRSYLSVLMGIREKGPSVLLLGYPRDGNTLKEEVCGPVCNRLCDLWIRTLASSFDPRISSWCKIRFEKGDTVDGLLTWQEHVEYLLPSRQCCVRAWNGRGSAPLA